MCFVNRIKKLLPYSIVLLHKYKLMRKIFILLVSVFVAANIFAQETKLYDPTADAEKDIAAVIKQAKEQHKYVLIMGGGNWCSWCTEFNRFSKADNRSIQYSIQPLSGTT